MALKRGLVSVHGWQLFTLLFTVGDWDFLIFFFLVRFFFLFKFKSWSISVKFVVFTVLDESGILIMMFTQVSVYKNIQKLFLKWTLKLMDIH